MNTRQQSAISYLKREILLHDGLGENHFSSYEYKQFAVTEHSDTGLVFLYTEVGLKFHPFHGII